MAAPLEGQGAEMDHAYVDEHQVAERYLLGALPPDEAARFEEHSLACAECLDRLETSEKLRLGLRAVAAREVAVEAVKLSLVARIVRSRLAPLGALLLVLVAVLPAGLLWRQVARLEGELAESRAAREGSPGEVTTAPSAELETSRAEAAEQRRLFETERKERERLAAELESARAPRTNVPVVSLSPERSAPGGAPSTRISLLPTTDWIVLALELDAPEYPAYRAILIDPDGRTAWQGSGLRADAQDQLTIALPAAHLSSGDFKVKVEGLPGRGKPASVAEFSFRVVRGS